MRSAFLNRLFLAISLAALAPIGQAQDLDTRWRLQVRDAQQKVRVDATVRFAGDAATESCLAGKWKRVVVEAKAVQDNGFFPLNGPLAYQAEDGRLTLGRTALCDNYLLLSSGRGPTSMRGQYRASGIQGGERLGYFTLTRLP